MSKTKLGLSTGLVAAMFFLLLMMSVFISTSLFALPALVLGAYVLYKEEDLWLKASVVKGFLLVAFVFFISICLGYVGDFLSFINFFLGIAETEQLRDGFGIISWIENIIRIIEKIFLMLLTISAFKGKTVKLPLIDKIIVKHIS